MPRQADRAVVRVLVLLSLPVFSSLFLFSCGARKSPKQIAIRVGDDFAGVLRIRPCAASGSVDNLSADERGAAETSVCPYDSEQITLLVSRAGKTYRISPENVTVVRAGDGLPVSIEARVPERE
jgi:hypothetical protein